MASKNKPKSRTNNVVIQESKDEILIYDLITNKAYCLNETSAYVWKLCDGNNSIIEISESLGKKLNLPANEDLVWFALDQLKKEKLIANGDELISHFAGLNRREVIRKVGLGTMIALPLVAGIIAPTSAHAASCAGLSTIAENFQCTAACQCIARGAGNPTPQCCVNPGNGQFICREVPLSATCV